MQDIFFKNSKIFSHHEGIAIKTLSRLVSKLDGIAPDKLFFSFSDICTDVFCRKPFTTLQILSLKYIYQYLPTPIGHTVRDFFEVSYRAFINTGYCI